jgi:hypothetical protein
VWFGPDCVLCQLSLMQILSWFGERSVPASRLFWVAQHGGELRPEQIADAFASRRSIVASQVRLAGRVWRAFRQRSPAGLSRLLKADLSLFPGLRGVVIRVLQEYPAKRNGLSRLESLLLREIDRRERTKASVAVGSVLAGESVGDSLLFEMLRSFVRASHPLLRLAEPLAGEFDGSAFNGAMLEMTDVGRRVLGGRADHVLLNGIDRWIGGVWLHGDSWRWDGKARTIVAA